MMMRCAIWYPLYDFKNMKNIHGGVLLLVKLQAEAETEACNFAKSDTPPWVFFMFFKLRVVPNRATLHHVCLIGAIDARSYSLIKPLV